MTAAGGAPLFASHHATARFLGDRSAIVTDRGNSAGRRQDLLPSPAMGKVLKAGGEVDSYCTACKLVLNHRIIAMVGAVPKRVECSTCSSHHNFRATMPGEKKPAASGASSSGPKSTRSPRGAGAAMTRAAAAEAERVQTWEKAIAGRAMSDFRVYRVTLTFEYGDLVRHSKFGDGVVTRVIDPKKVEVLFKDESRTLAQAME